MWRNILVSKWPHRKNKLTSWHGLSNLQLMFSVNGAPPHWSLDLELEVNEDDIEQEHEDELMTKELPTIVHVQTYLAESTLSHNNFVLFRNVIKEVVDLTSQINLGVDSYDVNELILVQELESSDPVQSEGITVEIFQKTSVQLKKCYKFLEM
ncbi:hypothetical protein TNCV_4586171 [Trichonephila clavipes]|nr:hypothetical protein TNCV_4586171 [Trichonephila clavipes]